MNLETLKTAILESDVHNAQGPPLPAMLPDRTEAGVGTQSRSAEPVSLC